jgi:hypothetical protein
VFQGEKAAFKSVPKASEPPSSGRPIVSLQHPVNSSSSPATSDALSSRPFDFFGVLIDVVSDERGVWVPLKRMCQILGVDSDGQNKKLKGKLWAVTDLLRVKCSDNKAYRVLCLHLGCLSMWIASLEVSRVKESLRDKIENCHIVSATERCMRANAGEENAWWKI